MSNTRVVRGEIPMVGLACCTEPHFTNQIAGSLGLPELRQYPQETEGQFLIRRLNQLKWVNRHWAAADLAALSQDMLALAGQQICHTAADYAQDRAAEQLYKPREVSRPPRPAPTARWATPPPQRPDDSPPRAA